MKRRLLASLLTLVMMLSLLPTAALAADEGSTSKVYTVTKDISYSTAGEIPDTVEEGQDLTVELKDQSEAKIVSAYAEIKDSAAPKNLLAKSDNPNESKLVFANQSTNGDRTPNMSTQELTPAMKSFYSNSYLITKSAGDLDYDSCNAALFAEKPATVSLGFWIQKTDNMVDEFPFWLIYQNKENYGERYLQVNIPVKDLVAGGKNTRQTVSLEGKNQNLIVTSASSEAKCLENQGDWYYISYVLSNIEYFDEDAANKAFDPNMGSLVYLYLNFRLGDKKSVNVMGLQAISGEEITNPYFVYPTEYDSSAYYWMYLDNNTQLSIPAGYITGNVTIHARAHNDKAPVITGVVDKQSYDQAVTPVCTDTDISSVILERDGAVVSGYTLGTPIAAKGSYSLRVTNASGKSTTLTFTIRSKSVSVDFQYQNRYVTVSGDNTATPGEDYSFNVTAKDSSVSVREVKVELATGAEELNQVNGSETTLLSATTAPNVNTIGVDAVQDSNLPVGNAYKYTLNYSHANSSSDTSSVYRRISNVNLTRGKPNAFSFSFWISEASLTTLKENALDIWFSYVDELAQGLKVSLPIKNLCESVGTVVPLAAIYVAGDSNQYLSSGDYSAVCLEKQGNWYRICLNAADLQYSDLHTDGMQEAFYFVLPTQLWKTMNAEKTTIELCGLSLLRGTTINSKDTYVEDGKTVLPLGAAAGTYTVPGKQIQANMTVIVISDESDAPHITGVENGQEYQSSATPSCADTDIATVTLTRDGIPVNDYQLGQTLTQKGNYVLTVTDRNNNTTEVTFSVYHSYNVTKKGENIIIAGANSASDLKDYEFTLAKSSDSVTLDQVYYEAPWSGKVIFSDSFGTAAYAGDAHGPRCEVVDHSAAPIDGIWKRAAKYSYDDSISGANPKYSVFTQKEYNVLNDKPKTISAGFWVNTENFKDLFPNDSQYIEVWVAYDKNAGAICQLPLKKLVEHQGESCACLLRLPSWLTSATSSASCIAKDGAWAYIALNLTDIVYAEGYTPSATQRVYLTLNGISYTLYHSEKSLEIAGLTMITGDTIVDTGINYSNMPAGTLQRVLRNADWGTNHIPASWINSDFTLVASGNDHTAPVITGVEDGKTYAIGDNSEKGEVSSVTPNCTDNDIVSISLKKDGNVIPFNFGDALTSQGSYGLTAIDKYGNKSTVEFILVAAGNVAITQNNTFVKTSLPAETLKEHDLNFSITLDGAANGVTAFEEGYAEISGAPGIEFNIGENTQTPAFLKACLEGDYNPEIEISSVDNDFPEKTLYPYKHIISQRRSAAQTGNKNTNYVSYPTTMWSGKPSEASIAFWIKDSSVENVFKKSGKGLEIWAAYQKTNDNALMGHFIVDLPAVTASVGTTQSISMNTLFNTFFETSTVTAECLRKEAGWSYVVINMTGLSYSEEFDTSEPASLYFLLNDQKNTMAASKEAAVEIAGLSVVAGSTRENDLVQYATSEGGRMVYPFAPKTAKNFTLPGKYVVGDIHFTFTANYGAGTATVTPDAASYDKNFLVQSDPTFTVSTNGDRVLRVLCDNVPLTESTDYRKTTEGNGTDEKITYTLSRNALNGLNVGEHTITFDMYLGRDLTTTLTVADTSKVDPSAPVQVYSDGDYIYVRTSFDETRDLVQAFTAYQSSQTRNAPMNFSTAKLVPVDAGYTAEGSVLSSSADEATPFNLNSSYIGANHGQSDGVEVIMANHGKTAADVGSRWEDSNGIYWNLLRVVDKDTLLFLSDNQKTPGSGYSFCKSITGNTLTYVSYGAHSDSINFTKQEVSVQVQPAIANIRIEAYAVKNGKRYLLGKDAPDAGCDYVEIEEYYDIIDPSTVAGALRAARPEGGYTEQPYIGVGKPIVKYHMTHRILADGTVLEIMDHKILDSVAMGYYGGIQYQQKKNTFGGGVYRYLPGTKGLQISDPSRVDNIIMKGDTVDSKYWTSQNAVPDRQVDYMRSSDGTNEVAFAGGYLPFDYNATAQKRMDSVDRWGFLYKSNKVYPAYVTSKAGVKNFEDQAITGVAYKKYFDASTCETGKSSWYTVEYNGCTYLYYDGFAAGTEVLELAPKLFLGSFERIAKSGEISYAAEANGIRITTEGNEKTYLVLKITPTAETICTVTFKNAETVLGTFYVKNGGSISTEKFPAIPNKTGYTGRWEPASLNNITADQTVAVVYTPISYSVRFMNGENVHDTKDIPFDSSYQLPETNPSKTGFVFEGWYTETTGGTKITASDKMVTANDHALYAHWTKCDHSGTTNLPTCTLPATCSVCGATLSATGHSWGSAKYTWNEISSGYTCAAERICGNGESHKETEIITANYAVTTAPTCTSKGEGTYTAIFENSAFTQQTKTIEIPAAGHDWSNKDGVCKVCKTPCGEAHTAGTTCPVCGKYTPIPVVPAGEPAKNPFNPDAGKARFVDVSDNAWYASAVNYVVDKGLMNGTGEDKFSPNADTTRGMIVTVLARLDGKSTAGTPWYAAGQRWAMEYEISDGTNMTGAITREQLVAMLFRYAVKNGLEAVTLSENLTQFTDASNISAWAVSAMQWAVGQGLIQGSNGQLRPQANASRAEVATILMRFCELMKK